MCDPNFNLHQRFGICTSNESLSGYLLTRLDDSLLCQLA